MYVQGLANFLDDLMGGLELLSLSILVGSLFWGALVLRVWRPDGAAPASAWRGSTRVLRAGALALAVTQALKILTKAAVLASALGELPLTVYAGTVQFQIDGVDSGSPVTLVDGSMSPGVTIFPGGANSVSTLIPFYVPIGAVSRLGAWMVTTGANVQLVAIGNLT